VDDEPLVLRAYLRNLPPGVEAVTAATVAEALDRIAAGELAAVLTDWRLPDGCARPVVAAARAAGLPVVVVSGTPPNPPPCPVLWKPLGGAELRGAVSALLP